MTTKKKAKSNTVGLADELGMVRAQMANLKVRADQIREILVDAGDDVYEDELFRAVVIEKTVSNTDWETIARKLNPTRQMIRANTTKQTVTQIRTSSRQGIAKAS